MNRRGKNIKWILGLLMMLGIILLSVKNIHFKSVKTYKEEQSELVKTGEVKDKDGNVKIIFQDETSTVGPQGVVETDEASEESESTKEEASQKEDEKEVQSKAQETGSKSLETTSKKEKSTSTKKTGNKKTTTVTTTTTHPSTSKVSKDSSAAASKDETEKKESNTSKKSQEEESTTDSYLECSLTIDVRELVQNPESLKEKYREFVPESGYLLSTVKVKVKEGTTVYELLQVACKKYDIAIDASFTASYDSYYVRSIGNLPEFAAGDNSGWLYFVNGSAPNQGASSYQIKDGEDIVWKYTVDYTKESMT